MTNSEFLYEFDLLYNNITSNQAPGLNAYEKSVYLTMALTDILKAYLNPKGNKWAEGIEDSSLRLIDFSNLITIYTRTKYKISSGKPGSNHALRETGEFIDPLFAGGNAQSVVLPSDIFSILNETVEVWRENESLDKILVVVPISTQEYNRILSSPYKYPLKNQAWKIVNTDNGTTKADLIPGHEDDLIGYTLRYIRKPKPIILENLEDGLSINGSATETSCEVDSVLHRDILKRAVELAKSDYIGDLESRITLGNSSSTNLGIINNSR